jgi:asparagine synthase (glutamine-hydrolysing)
MKGLCGWFSEAVETPSAADLDQMIAAASALDAQRHLAQQCALALYGTTARPRLVEVDGLTLIASGHPRLATPMGRNSDLTALARALAERGRRALTEIEGDFALAAWDGRRRRGLLAVDRIGAHRLMYARVATALVFATTLDSLAGHPAVPRRLSAQGLFDYLHYHVSPGPQTVFEGLNGLPPGHCIEFGAGAEPLPSPYWSMRFDEDKAPQLAALEAEFIAVLQSSVADAAAGSTCGAFLSGGTDSSTVSGMLGRIGCGPARTFSIGFDVRGYDEMEYARTAAQHFGCEHHEYYVTPNDVVDAVPRIAAAYDQPFGNASAIPTYYCARFAGEHGIERLLAGDGGDELFGGNERYAKQQLLGMYQHLPVALRRGLVEPLLANLPGARRLPLLRKLHSYVEQARPPMPRRYESTNLLNHLGVDNILEHDFLSAIATGHPQQLMDEAHAPFAGDSLINQMLGIDLRFILADGDLPKVVQMCDLAGVDVAFPLLDERVIAFSQRLPSSYKLKGTKLRWFFKHALRSFLPPAVISKQKHGFGLPVGTWLVEHRPLHDLAADSVGRLRQRGIVQPAFIDRLFSTLLREHPAYYGTMVWVLMMLSLWLDSRKL